MPPPPSPRLNPPPLRNLRRTCRACKHEFCWLCGGDYLGNYTFGDACNCKEIRRERAAEAATVAAREGAAFAAAIAARTGVADAAAG